MVDLVKIRKKAKEKKESEEGATVSDSADAPVAEEKPAPAPSRKAAPKSKAASAKTASKASTKPKPKRQPKRKPKPKPEPLAQPEAPDTAPVPEDVETLEQVPLPEETAPAEMPEPEASKDVASPQEPEEELAEAARPEDEGPPPDEKSLNRLAKFKQEAGKRRSWATEARKTEGPAAEDDVSNELELLRFKLAGEEYAVDIENIVEIVPPRGTTRVPNSDRAIVGIMSLRGTIVTVFDLRSKLGHPPVSEEPDIDPRMIVVERAGETAGFLVDRVSRVVKLDPSELESHPVVSAAEQSDYVDGVFQSADGLVILLDLEKILASQN